MYADATASMASVQTGTGAKVYGLTGDDLYPVDYQTVNFEKVNSLDSLDLSESRTSTDMFLA